MKKVFLFCFFGLLFPLSVFCQEFDVLVRQSISYFEQNNLQKFEETYPQLYMEYLRENIPSYMEAVDAIQEKNISLAFSNINDLIDEDLFLDEVEIDENFKILHEEEQWQTLIQKNKNN